jgi:hypothetical protein
VTASPAAVGVISALAKFVITTYNVPSSVAAQGGQNSPRGASSFLFLGNIACLISNTDLSKKNPEHREWA